MVRRSLRNNLSSTFILFLARQPLWNHWDCRFGLNHLEELEIRSTDNTSQPAVESKWNMLLFESFGAM